MPGALALRAAVDAELEGVGLHELRRAVEALSASYRSAPTSAPTLDDARRLAYVAVRMPATHAAMATVLAEAARVIPEEVASLLDLGAGPGTTLWAAADCFPNLAHATLVDRDAAMLTLGARLWRRHPRAPALQVVLQAQAIGTRQGPSADVVTMSYVLGELAGATARHAVDAAFAAAHLAIVIVEPGTPRGYQAILEARAALIAKGALIAAPCPHAAECPLTGADWCHFAARLERSRAHRLLKEATLAWEDEKYSYLIATRQSTPASASRILRHPRIEKGRIAVSLCTAEGLKDLVVRRSDRDLWRAARHAKWGSTWEGHPAERS